MQRRRSSLSEEQNAYTRSVLEKIPDETNYGDVSNNC